MEDIADLAIESGLNTGASFVDIRIEYSRSTSLDVVNEVTRNTKLATEKGAGIRAFVDGSWAFGYTSDLTASGIKKASESITKMALSTRKWIKEKFEIDAPSFKGRVEYKEGCQLMKLA